MNVVGIVEKQGVYQGSPYHNYQLHCTKPMDNQKNNGYGILTEFIKVKQSVLLYCMGEQGLKDVKDLLNREVDVIYDKYTAVTAVYVKDL